MMAANHLSAGRSSCGPLERGRLQHDLRGAALCSIFGRMGVGTAFTLNCPRAIQTFVSKEAVLGDTTFNVEQDLPGLHNFKPPEETVLGFRMNADGSTRSNAVPASRRNSQVDYNPFGLFNSQGRDGNAFTSVGNGSLSPYLTFSRNLYDGQLPPVDPEAVERVGMTPSEIALSGLPRPSSPANVGIMTSGGLPLGMSSTRSFQSLPVLGAAAGRTIDPNIVRGGDDGPVANDDIQIAQQQASPQSK